MTLYLDCNATTPIDPRVRDEVLRCFQEEIGNPGSPHELGRRAKELVHAARNRIANLVAARRHDVVFTSGATESNNLVLLGLGEIAQATGKFHIVSTQIEHKSVLEPLGELHRRGFQITLIPPQPNGRVDAAAVFEAIREDTLLVSLMHVNNETGVIQPVAELADALRHHKVLVHVDAAQGFGKELEQLQHLRIDFLSLSSHKIAGPAGIGALIARHRAEQPISIAPLMFGGGQELGLRPGTLPTALISGFGLAAQLAEQESAQRQQICRKLRTQLLQTLEPLRPAIHGDLDLALPHVLNVSFPGLDGEDVVEMLEGIAAVSNGSACTSVCAAPSHVLAAMQVPESELHGAVRFSWSHAIDPVQWESGIKQIRDRLIRSV